jgi:hypothetical protein
MRSGVRRIGATFVAAAVAGLVVPAASEATRVGLGATATEPSECFSPQQAPYASTSCQVFDGGQLEIVALATRDEGGVRLMPQPFTLFELRRRGGPLPIVSFTHFDGNDADDDPLVTPTRNTDYELRFNGNQDMPPGTSATMAVQVGARIAIPSESSSGRSTRIRVPATVTVPRRALRGRIELRRCHRTKATSARSCARPRSYTVVASRRATRTRTVAFGIAAPARSYRRYEIAFRPRSARFATTRQPFTVLNGYDGVTSYRPTVRSAPFGNR